MQMRTRTLITIALSLTTLTAAVAWHDTRTAALDHVVVPVPGLSRPVTILHASDLHGVMFGDDQSDIAALLDGSHYDAAVINGDHVASADDDNAAALAFLSVLQRHAEIVFVTRGNHDSEATIEALVAAGAVAVEPAGAAVPFARDAGALLAVPAIEPADVPDDVDVVVALSHCPLTRDAQAEYAQDQPGTTLFLFGHTHGGQIRLPLIGALWAPGEMSLSGVAPPRATSETLLPEMRGRHIAGLSSDGDVHAHISQGLGTQAIRLRLLAPAGMTVITLTP